MSVEFELQRALPPTVPESAEATSVATPATVLNSTALNSHQLAARGWISPLAISVAGLAAIQTITGLWVYLSPFSSLAQFQVLLHTAAGLLFIVPFGWYVVHHFLMGGQARMAKSSV